MINTLDLIEFIKVIFMRIDLCRNCGNELRELQKCHICHEPMQFYCNDCSFITQEQFHSECNLELNSITEYS